MWSLESDHTFLPTQINYCSKIYMHVGICGLYEQEKRTSTLLFTLRQYVLKFLFSKDLFTYYV